MRIADQIEREFHIFGRERFAVMPGHAFAQLHLPRHPVRRDAAIRNGGYFRGQTRQKHAIGIHRPKRAEQAHIDCIVHFDMRQKRIFCQDVGVTSAYGDPIRVERR